MAAFLCRVCGGALELAGSGPFCSCSYCGTMQSVPLLDSEEKAELCGRAEQLRREFRYDKAMALYERLIGLSPTDAGLYWALTLCRYGVEYSADGNVIINRIQAHSVLSDEDYKLALKFADDEARAVMERQAEQIDIARRSGAELAGSSEYDVFLCAREADENGRRIMDSVIAAELYKRLCAEGFKVFFPQKSLEDKFGGEWEPYIFAALSSAKAMVVVGTNAESFDEVWVRNAWSRFSKTIIPVVRDMPPNELPDEIAELQVLDMSRLGAENDLIAAIKALTGKRSEVPEAVTADDPMIRRAALLLEDGDFGKAEEIAAQLLSRSPDNAEAYVIRLLAEYRLPNEQALDSLTSRFSNSENYRLAMLHGGEPLRHRLKEHYNRAVCSKSAARLNADDERDILASAVETETLEGLSNAAELTEKFTAKNLAISSAVKNFSSGEEPKRRSKYLPFAAAGAGAAAVAAAAVIITASAMSPKPDKFVDNTPQSITQTNDPMSGSGMVAGDTYEDQAYKYAKACAELEEGNYSEAELLFIVLGDYKDSANNLNECKYQSAAALLESGEFDAAERAFERLGKYSDSGEMVLQCQYQKAQSLFESGDHDSAKAMFKALNGKWESKDFIKRIDYAAAEKLLYSGDLEGAKKAFENLGDFSDSAERVKEARYKSAAKLMANGDHQAAADEFDRLGSYSDSRTQYCRAYYSMGQVLARQNKYSDAIAAFGEAGSYSDAAQQMTKVRNDWVRYAYSTKYAHFEFGHYYHYFYNDISEPIRWRVLTIENDMALVYAENPIDYLQFDSADPKCTWQNSSLRRRLNGEFYETSFNDSEKAQIRMSVFETESGHLNYVGTSGSGISDKIFLLNTEEAKKSPWAYGSLMKYSLTAYAQKKLPEDYGTLFNWGRDMPLYQSGGSVDTVSLHCVSPAMWIYIGD